MKSKSLIANKSYEFSLLIIALYKKLQAEREYIISKQLLRSGTSIGANAQEAISAVSKKDFVHKLSISQKEARESQYWLHLLRDSEITKVNVDLPINECERLICILSSIIKTTRASLGKR